MTDPVDFDISGDVVSELLFHISQAKTLLLAPLLQGTTCSLSSNYNYMVEGPTGTYCLKLVPLGYGSMQDDNLLFTKLPMKNSKASPDNEFVKKIIEFPAVTMHPKYVDILLGAYIMAYNLQGTLALPLADEQHFFGVTSINEVFRTIGDNLTDADANI